MRKRAMITSVVFAALCGAISCAPQAARYVVSQTLVEYCSTRLGQSDCQNPTDSTQTLELLIEPGADSTLIVYGGQSFLASTQTPLYAERQSRVEDLSSSCAQEQRQVLQLVQSFGEVSGSYEKSLVSTGPQGSCGETPFGESWRWNLQGTEEAAP